MGGGGGIENLYFANMWNSKIFHILGDMIYIVKLSSLFNPFKAEFAIVIFIHYKPRIAIAILVVDEDDSMWFIN